MVASCEGCCCPARRGDVRASHPLCWVLREAHAEGRREACDSREARRDTRRRLAVLITKRRRLPPAGHQGRIDDVRDALAIDCHRKWLSRGCQGRRWRRMSVNAAVGDRSCRGVGLADEVDERDPASTQSDGISRRPRGDSHRGRNAWLRRAASSSPASMRVDDAAVPFASAGTSKSSVRAARCGSRTRRRPSRGTRTASGARAHEPPTCYPSVEAPP